MCTRIDKASLSIRDINEIKNDCFVEGRENQYGPASSLRAYGETPNALYVPFAYAKKRFEDSPNKDAEFSPASYAFYLDKFPYRTDGGRDQQQVFNEALRLIRVNRSVLLSLFCGFGKCLARDTPVLLYNGTVKMVQDITVGDFLMGDDSTPRKVLSLARGREEMYTVLSKRGEPYTVNKSHILSFYISGNKNITKFNRDGWTVEWFDHTQLKSCTRIFYFHHYSDNPEVTYRAAEEFAETLDSPNTIDLSVTEFLRLPPKCSNMLLGYKVGVEYPEKNVHIDPYTLGYWLGDVEAAATGITTMEQPILDHIRDQWASLGLQLNQIHFSNSLREYNLLGNKHVPQIYKANSRKIRLQVLAGLLDSGGSLQKNCFVFVRESELLAGDVVYLARSVGLNACMTTEASCRVSISGHIDMIPTKLKSKQATRREEIKNPLATRIQLVPKGIDDYYGFTIDGNGRFLLGDFTVTHNTYIGIRLAHQSRLKTAILAHRSVLIDQWEESITKFTDAKVQRVDTDGHLDPEADFYIFNIAFVHKRWVKSTKSWGQKKLGAFKNIGLLIVDEAHIACAEEMSRALLYFNPRINIALTATPVRKDGMDKVLELYFGDYNTTRIVRIAQNPFTVYRLPTGVKPEFTRNKFGKKDWNSVIESLVEDKERNKIILGLVKKFAEYNILILTKRKKHCNLLSRKLTKLAISNTVMVGVQKKYDKTARVLLSTYSKLGVGFDDTRLNMLIVACSVTEVEQYAGRLRDGKNKKRIIVDLVDNDGNCLKHWQERRKWYISRNGQIENYYKIFPKEKTGDTGEPDEEAVETVAKHAEKPKRLARRLPES